MDQETFLDEIAKIVEIKAKRETRDRARIVGSISQKESAEYFPGYNVLVEKYEAAKVHAQGLVPSKLFKAIAPLQSAEELEYIKAIYESETSDVYTDFTNTIKKAVTNGIIEFATSDNDDSNDLESYLDNDIDGFDSIKAWADAMVDDKVIDANGVIVIWPSKIETDEAGIIIGEVKPQPIIYPVPNIVWKNADDEFIVLTSHTSNVEFASKIEKTGLVFRYVGKERYMEARQVGKKIDKKFEVVLNFDHGIVNDNKIPFSPATYQKGKAVLVEDSVVFMNDFDPAVPHLNLAALHASNALIIWRKVGYPTRVVTLSKCKHEEQGATCDNGVLHIADGMERKQIKCPACKGTGTNRVFGPMSELVLTEPDAMDESKSSTNATNAMNYVSPPIDTPVELGRLSLEKIDRAKEVLHLKSQARGSGDISATEKNRDKENTEAFIRPISTQIWSNIAFVVECIGRLKFPESYESIKPNIIEPSNFDLVTAEDYVAEISAAREGNLPKAIIQNLVYNYMQKVHKNSSLSMRVYELIESSDRLVAETTEEITLGLSRGTVQPWEAVLHTSVFYIIHKLLREDPKFIDLPTEIQIKQIEDAAKAMVIESDGLDLPPIIEP